MKTTTYGDAVQGQQIQTETTSFVENVKGIENHKKVALHLEAAARLHREAARFHEADNHEQAYKSSLMAYGHQIIAAGLGNEDLKHHAARYPE